MRKALIGGTVSMVVISTACGGGGSFGPRNPRVDVALRFEVPDEAVVDQAVEIRAVVENNGPSLLSGATLRMELSGDAELTVMPIGSQADVEVGADFIEWSNFFVPSRSSQTFTFDLTPDAGGSLTLDLSYDSELTDTNPANDRASLTLQVRGSG